MDEAHLNRVIALLPFTTPHYLFEKGSAFHPAALLSPLSKKAKTVKDRTDYSGYSSVAAAAGLTSRIVATIPPASTPAGLMLKELLATHVNTRDVLSEVICVEHEDPSIASQVEVAFKTFDDPSLSVLVVWPYQFFDVEEPFLSSGGNHKFAFLHGNANFDRSTVPEGIGLSYSSISESEMVCRGAVLYNEVDPIVQGQYAAMLSAVEITPNEWAAFKASGNYPNIHLLLKDTLVGERGVLVNTRRCGFI